MFEADSSSLTVAGVLACAGGSVPAPPAEAAALKLELELAGAAASRPLAAPPRLQQSELRQTSADVCECLPATSGLPSA